MNHTNPRIGAIRREINDIRNRLQWGTSTPSRTGIAKSLGSEPRLDMTETEWSQSLHDHYSQADKQTKRLILDIATKYYLTKTSAITSLVEIDDDEKCVICLGKMSGDVSLRECGHIFHPKCLATYYRRAWRISGPTHFGYANCPSCRATQRKL